MRRGKTVGISFNRRRGSVNNLVGMVGIEGSESCLELAFAPPVFSITSRNVPRPPVRAAQRERKTSAECLPSPLPSSLAVVWCEGSNEQRQRNSLAPGEIGEEAR